jgi:hypothetical protein
MRRAIEKLADRDRLLASETRREVICPHCAVHCSVVRDVPLEETVCVACVRRLSIRSESSNRPLRAVHALADWWDKAAVRGPGYGVVHCPSCESECVVEIGEAARTLCAGCVRPLGPVPLLRVDLAARREASIDDGSFTDDATAADGPRWFVADRSSISFPGEPL